MFLGATPAILRPSLLSAILKPQDVFIAQPYTWDGNSPTTISAPFDPDFAWLKSRDQAADHFLFSRLRGNNKFLRSNQTATEGNTVAGYGEFVTGGFKPGGATGSSIAWLLKYAPKFCVEVTWTGDGTSNRQIPHGLGVVPGMIVVKRRDLASQWIVTHRSLTQSLYDYLLFNSTGGQSNGDPTVFGMGTSATNLVIGGSGAVNQSGNTYVAYLFAHDPSADGIVQCGGVNTGSDGSVSITLPWQAQWIMIKSTSAASPWFIVDATRGLSPGYKLLYANLSNAEYNGTKAITVTASSISIPGGELFADLNSIVFAVIRAPY